MPRPDKVVSFTRNQTKNASGKSHNQGQSETSASSTELFYDKVNGYKALLELQAQVMDELYQLTENMPRNCYSSLTDEDPALLREKLIVDF